MTVTLSRLHLIALFLVAGVAVGYYIFVYEKTPIDFVVCRKTGGDCILIARMKNLETCAQIKQRYDPACDIVSRPGFMDCVMQPSRLGESYCTR